MYIRVFVYVYTINTVKCEVIPFRSLVIFFFENLTYVLIYRQNVSKLSMPIGNCI